MIGEAIRVVAARGRPDEVRGELRWEPRRRRRVVDEGAIDPVRVAAGERRIRFAALRLGFRDGRAGRARRRLYTDLPRFLFPWWERGHARGVARRARGQRCDGARAAPSPRPPAAMTG